MSERAWDWAWRCRGVTLDQRLVLLALAEHADAHGECFIHSPGPLERMTELNKRRMAKVLDALEAAQLIVAERGGFAGLTRYRLLLDGPEAGASGSTGDGSRPADPGSFVGRHRQFARRLRYGD
jgi:hypothetical protein